MTERRFLRQKTPGIRLGLTNVKVKLMSAIIGRVGQNFTKDFDARNCDIPVPK
jgi:hypothetical protein